MVAEKLREDESQYKNLSFQGGSLARFLQAGFSTQIHNLPTMLSIHKYIMD